VDTPYRTASYSRLRCPRCDVGLLTRSVGHVKVDECSSCRGVWVDNRTMGSIIEDLALHVDVRAAFPQQAAPPTLRDRPGPMYVHCPACRDIMNRRQFAPGSKVVVDVCRADGLWFDAGELTLVVDFCERRGDELLREREQEAKLRARAALHASRQYQPAASTPYLDSQERDRTTLAEVILGVLLS
jgi:Zn-finger nucleic acid-binding protein